MPGKAFGRFGFKLALFYRGAGKPEYGLGPIPGVAFVQFFGGDIILICLKVFIVFFPVGLVLVVYLFCGVVFLFLFEIFPLRLGFHPLVFRLGGFIYCRFAVFGCPDIYPNRNLIVLVLFDKEGVLALVAVAAYGIIGVVDEQGVGILGVASAVKPKVLAVHEVGILVLVANLGRDKVGVYRSEGVRVLVLEAAVLVIKGREQLGHIEYADGAVIGGVFGGVEVFGVLYPVFTYLAGIVIAVGNANLGGEVRLGAAAGSRREVGDIAEVAIGIYEADDGGVVVFGIGYDGNFAGVSVPLLVVVNGVVFGFFDGGHNDVIEQSHALGHTGVILLVRRARGTHVFGPVAQPELDVHRAVGGVVGLDIKGEGFPALLGVDGLKLGVSAGIDINPNALKVFIVLVVYYKVGVDIDCKLVVLFLREGYRRAFVIQRAFVVNRRNHQSVGIGVVAVFLGGVGCYAGVVHIGVNGVFVGIKDVGFKVDNAHFGRGVRGYAAGGCPVGDAVFHISVAVVGVGRVGEPSVLYDSRIGNGGCF